jgi:predicted deacylase
MSNDSPAAFPWSFVPAPEPGGHRADYFTWPEPVLAGQRWPYFALRGRTPGPSVAITAAIHGGEYPGPLGALRFAREVDPSTLRGSLLILPLVNLPSFWARTAFVTPQDGRNLNRVFPGKAVGTFGEVLAFRVMTDVYSPADAVIDLHSGDIFEALADHAMSYHSDNPAINDLSVRMLKAFGLPYSRTYPMPRNPGGTAGNATLIGKPSILVEVGGNGLASETNVASVYDGIVNTLRELGVLPGAAEQKPQRTVRSGAQVVSPATGLWRPNVTLEQQVAEGDLLGTLTDPLGEELARVTAPTGGMVLYYMTTLAVHEGEPLVNIVIVE